MTQVLLGKELPHISEGRSTLRLSLRVDDVGIVRICLLGDKEDLQNNQLISTLFGSKK